MAMLSKRPYLSHNPLYWERVLTRMASVVVGVVLALVVLLSSISAFAEEEQPWRNSRVSRPIQSSDRSHVTVSSDSSMVTSSQGRSLSTGYPSSSSTGYPSSATSASQSTVSYIDPDGHQKYVTEVNIIVGGLVEHYGALSWIHWDSLLRVTDVTSDPKEKLLPHLGIRHKPGDPYQDDEFSQTKLSMATLAESGSYYRLYENVLTLVARRADGTKPESHPGHHFFVGLVQAILRELHPPIIHYLKKIRPSRDHYQLGLFASPRTEKLYTSENWSVIREKALKDAFYSAFDSHGLWDADFSVRSTAFLSSLGLLSMSVKQKIRSLPTTREKNEAFFEWFDSLGAGGYLAFLRSIANAQVLRHQAVRIVESLDDREIADELNAMILDNGRRLDDSYSDSSSVTTTFTLYSQYSALSRYTDRVRRHGWSGVSSPSSAVGQQGRMSHLSGPSHMATSQPSSRSQQRPPLTPPPPLRHQQPSLTPPPRAASTQAQSVQAWLQSTAQASAEGFARTEDKIEWETASQFSSVSETQDARMPKYSSELRYSSDGEAAGVSRSIGYQMQIAELTKQLQQQHLQLQEQKQVYQCGICFDMAERWLVGPCGHEYCEECTNTLPRDFRNRIKCPSCSKLQDVSNYITRYQSLPAGLMSEAGSEAK